MRKASGMANSPELRSALALGALSIQAPLVQDALLEDRQFRDEYGIEMDGVLAVGEAERTFSSSVLCGAVRKALASTVVQGLADTEGREWRVEMVRAEAELPKLLLYRDGERLTLPLEFVALSSDRETRLELLEEAASHVNLPTEAVEFWRPILQGRPLDDYEVQHLQADRLDTPVARRSAIRMEIERGEGSPSTLVPPSRRYFERLVGKYDGSKSINDYAGGGGKAVLQELAAWRPVDGLLLSLLLSSHSSLSDQISVDHVGEKDLLVALDNLAKHGDRISQIGAIEVGFRILKSRPEVEQALCRLIREIREDGDSDQASGFKLLSALFWFVDGEISRMRLFPDEPSFYRRLAALSQAALIHRQLVELRVDPKPFSDWALGWPPWHYQQSLVDLRLEPRWRPEYGSEAQLKAELFGRILIAGRRHEESVKGTDVYDLVFGENSSSLRSLSNPVYSFLPGPLEGVEGNRPTIPSELQGRVETELEGERVGISTFVAMGNLAGIYRIDPKYAELAGEAVKRAGHRLAEVQDSAELFGVVNGLATVAAVARSSELADQLRILCRRYRRDGEYSLGIQETLVICLVAAASRPGLEEWMEYVGDWLTELAFSELEEGEGRIAYAFLTGLCHAVPELWIHCGRAEAALKAFNAR